MSTTVKKTGDITYSLTLTDGQRFEMAPTYRPRFWKSDLMRLAPYGTSFVGATWARVAN